jgi:hypothetical protein
MLTSNSTLQNVWHKNGFLCVHECMKSIMFMRVQCRRVFVIFGIVLSHGVQVNVV